MTTPINEITVKALNKELADLLTAFATKHGLSKGNQRIVYARDGSTMKVTVEFGSKAVTGEVNPVYFKNTARHGMFVGLSTKNIGTKVQVGRLGLVEFVGMSSPKFAIVKAADGRLFKYDPQVLSALLKAANQG
jgi:hypothetical protein